MQVVAKELVLVVDDEPQVLVALEDLLGEKFTVLKTASAEDALRLMDRERDIAVVITDQRMPRMNGDELLAQLGDSSDAQRILITGFADLAAVIRAVNDGKISAYVTKPWDAEDLQLKVQTAAEHFRLAKELARERQALHDQTRILNSILDSMGEGVVAVGETGEVLLFNRRARQILGTQLRGVLPADWMKTCGAFQADGKSEIPRDQDPLLCAMKGAATPETELFVRRATGPSATVAVTATGLLDDEGKLAGGIALLRDVTQQRSLEQQLVQAQKMEAIGRLAGGVAHDFNNLLLVILSYGELVMHSASPDSPSRNDLAELIAAAQRAAGLTRQLLAFSRRQMVQSKTLQLNEIVSEVERMLRRVIGEDIELATKLWPTLGMVKADAGQLEQIVVNLTVNARDAMPNGGKLTIETANVRLDENYAATHAGVAPGEFVMLVVSDTGTGMDPETKRHIFEPFFTTKEVGSGTGLGLSTVYGIVQQSGGHIWVDSEPGYGTSFKIYFPRADGVAATSERRSQPAPAAKATGTILLVEDDEAVRRVAVRMLRDFGYTVFEAKSGSDARRICAERGSSIDLLLTDVVMPEVRGPALAQELSRAHPQMRIAYMSGYSAPAIGQEPVMEAGVPCIEKPFSPTSLAEKIREILTASD